MKCRYCGPELKLSLVDLGSAPPSNAYLTEQTPHAPEKWFPLRVRVCERGWLAHSERYVADMGARFNLTADSHVVEAAAHDGYLLHSQKNTLQSALRCKIALEDSLDLRVDRIVKEPGKNKPIYQLAKTQGARL